MVSLSSWVEYSDPLLPLLVRRRRALVAAAPARLGAPRRGRPRRLSLLLLLGDFAATVGFRRSLVFAEVAGVLVVSLHSVIDRRRGRRPLVRRPRRRRPHRLLIFVVRLLRVGRRGAVGAAALREPAGAAGRAAAAEAAAQEAAARAPGR